MQDDTKEFEMQNITEQGTAPAERIATGAAAKNIYKQLKDVDAAGDAKRRAILQGMIDGNPPYRDKDLRDRGLGHVTNVNFLSMRANLDARAASCHELFAEVPTLVDLKPRSALRQSPDAQRYCHIISEEFTETVNDWDGFLSTMDLIWRDCDTFGLGIGVFPNEWDWKMKAFHRGNLLIDPKAGVDIDENDLIMIRDEMSVADIFRLLEDAEVSTESGWDVGKLKDLAVYAYKEGGVGIAVDKYQRSEWESVLQMYRNGDVTYQAKQFERVKIIHVFVREVSEDKKVTHLIVPETDGQDYFIYKRLNKYDKMSNVAWWMMYNYGDGYAKSVRGVASYMAQHEDLSNKFLCRVFDAGFLNSSLLLQPNSQLDIQKLRVMNVGPYTILPPGLQAVQSTFQPQIAPLVQLRGVSENVMKNNTGTYRQHSELTEREGMKTATQVQSEISKEAKFEKQTIAARYKQLDKLYTEMFRRMLNEDVIAGDKDIMYPGAEESRDFFKRCIDRGVPKAVLLDWKKNFKVAAYRTIGLGSLGVKYDITGQLLNISGMFDESGRRAAIRDFVAARVGYGNAERYVADVDRDMQASDAASVAMLEFNDVVEGSQVLVGSDQLHRIHIEVFKQCLMPILQAAQQGQTQDPMTDARTVQLGLQHIMQHLQYVQQDPLRKAYVKETEQFIQQASQILQTLVAIAERLQKQMQQQQQEQQETVAQAQKTLADRELEAKLYEINAKMQIERFKQESLNNMRADKTAVQNEINTAKASADIARKAAMTNAQIALDTQRTAAEIANKRAKG